MSVCIIGVVPQRRISSCTKQQHACFLAHTSSRREDSEIANIQTAIWWLFRGNFLIASISVDLAWRHLKSVYFLWALFSIGKHGH